MSAHNLLVLVDEGEQRYLPNLACMLTNLGGIYYDIGNYALALDAARNSFKYASKIQPPDGNDALEHVADALTGQGLAELKIVRHM